VLWVADLAGLDYYYHYLGVGGCMINGWAGIGIVYAGIDVLRDGNAMCIYLFSFSPIFRVFSYVLSLYVEFDFSINQGRSFGIGRTIEGSAFMT
jgi:hypothetical protein